MTAPKPARRRSLFVRWGTLTAALLGLLVLLPKLASAHERFVKHDMKNPLQDGFFQQQAGKLFGMDPNMIQVGLLVSFILTAFLLIWFLRESLDEFIRYKVLMKLGGTPQRLLHGLACFIMDKPVRSAWFYTFGAKIGLHRISVFLAPAWLS